MKLSEELIELRRNARIKSIEEKNPLFFSDLRNSLKKFAEDGLNTYDIPLETLPKDVSMSTVEEWTELNGMEFDWECHRHPFQICF